MTLRYTIYCFFRCDQCSAAYPLLATLKTHKSNFHRNSVNSEELAIPVIDINQPSVMEQLHRLGVVSVIPLTQLKRSAGGVYGLPIINIVPSQPKCYSTNNFFGAGNVFTLGKLKPLAKRKSNN